MYPTTIFEVVDNSNNPILPKQESVQPLFMMGFSSPKGKEDLTVVKGDLFTKIYGKDISFAKHGQPLLQAASIIAEGGTLLAKRVVASDATLANVAVIAKVKEESLQKKNATGELLFLDKTSGKETIVSTGNEPIMIPTAVIVYECKSIKNAKDLETIKTSIETELDTEGATENTFVYPLFILTDNGRGVSNKRFRITPDYNASKHLDFMKYNFSTIEKNELIETFTFTFNHNIVESGTNRSLENVIKTSSNQLCSKLFENNVNLFVEKVALISKIPVDTLVNNDILFGRDRKSNILSGISIDFEEGFNLSYAYGLDLESGDNGKFKDAPFGTEEYTKQLVELFDGTFSNEIYDLDNYKLDLIIDANYPKPVKRAIEKFAEFREDAEYFRDMGLGLRTIEDLLAANIEQMPSRHSATYCTTYDIIDPYTKKQIPVTIGYSLCKLMIKHFKNGRNRPTAGQLHNMVIPEAIEGTVNFLPKITPTYNQKEILVENKINYASFFDGMLTLETLLTSQEQSTQLSYINNVLAMQEVVKAIRARCPKTRYSFIDGDDLEKYREDVEVVLNKYYNNFVQLKMVYVKDEAMLSNKIFYAALEVKFRNFVQTEYFKIYALS